MSLNIFITGGTSGLGLSLARAYKKQGACVAVCGRDLSKVESDDFIKYQVNVTSKDEVQNAINKFGRDRKIDIVIACAGRSFERKTQVPDYEISKEIIETNLFGVLNTFQSALPKMLDQKHGQLVAISSVAGLCGFPGVSAYSASKAAVMKLCEGYQVDLSSLGITTTCIAPGFIKTPLTDKNHHKMPFIMSCEKATTLCLEAIRKRKAFYTFPFFFSHFLIFLSFLPRGLYIKLMKFYKFKYASAVKTTNR